MLSPPWHFRWRGGEEAWAIMFWKKIVTKVVDQNYSEWKKRVVCFSKWNQCLRTRSTSSRLNSPAALSSHEAEQRLWDLVETSEHFQSRRRTRASDLTDGIWRSLWCVFGPFRILPFSLGCLVQCSKHLWTHSVTLWPRLHVKDRALCCDSICTLLWYRREKNYVQAVKQWNAW